MVETDDIILLTESQVQEVLSAEDAFAAIEQAYGDLAAGKAINRPSSWAHLGHPDPGTVFQFSSMEGGSGDGGYFAIRILSHPRAQPLPSATRSRERQLHTFGGMIMVFRTQDGEPIALIPQATISTYRLAGTSRLAARYLARADTSVLGVLGTGRHATGHALAMAQEFRLTEIRVFSPNPEHVARFADVVGEATGVPVTTVKDSRAAAACDLLVTATTSRMPVYELDWVRPGMCVVSMNARDIPKGMEQHADVVAVKGKRSRLKFASAEVTDVPDMEPTPDPVEYGDLADVMAGRAPGRSSPGQITFFHNNEGLGIEFAGPAARACRIARDRGIGQRVPRAWMEG